MPSPARTIEGPTPNSPAIALARLGQITQGQGGVNDNDWINVHFNPASLQLQLSNELKDADRNHPAQYIAKSTAKLSMELQFDCTDTGQNVIQTTRKLQVFLAPQSADGQSAEHEPPPPLVLFEWGAFTFKGIIESYTETTDFFSASGVPLRSLVKLTLKKQDVVFEPAGSANPPPDPSFDVPARSPAAAAREGNNPSAARGIAAANGLESLRFNTGASLTVGAQVQLKPPSGFVSADASAGLSIGGGTGFSIGGGVGVSGGISGLAKLSASEGAFAGLRTNVSVAAPTVSRARLTASSGSGSFAMGAGASFRVGGSASVQGAAGLRSNVSGNGSFNKTLRFDAF